MMEAIKANKLTRVFDHLLAVDHISFEVEEGEIFAFLGANGAGKTTTIMMLATALNPSSGTASVCGFAVIKELNRGRESIGIVFEEPSLDIDLSGKENLDFHARMYHLGEKMRRERIARALDLVGLKGEQNMLVKHYSGGMQRRLEIARGMLNEPRVLFLDEPTLGLDVQTRRMLWNYARELNRESGTTILLNTHYIEEADYLCDRVAVLERGKIVAMDSSARLKRSLGDSLILMELSRKALGEELVKMLSKLDWVSKVAQRNGLVELSIRGGGVRIPQVVRWARDHGFALSSIVEREPSLEDVFLHYTGRKLQQEDHE